MRSRQYAAFLCLYLLIAQCIYVYTNLHTRSTLVDAYIPTACRKHTIFVALCCVDVLLGYRLVCPPADNVSKPMIIGLASSDGPVTLVFLTNLYILCPMGNTLNGAFKQDSGK